MNLENAEQLRRCLFLVSDECATISEGDIDNCFKTEKALNLSGNVTHTIKMCINEFETSTKIIQRMLQILACLPKDIQTRFVELYRSGW